MRPRVLVLQNRVVDFDLGVAVHGDAGFCVPASSRVFSDHGIVDDDIAFVVVGDEKDGAAMSRHTVVLDQRATEGERHGVAIVVDCASAAAPRRSRFRGIAAVTNRLVVREKRVNDRPRNADTADAAAIGAAAAVVFATAKGAVDDINRLVLELIEDADRRAADIRASVCTGVVEKAAVDDLDAPSASKNGATPILFGLGVAVGEGDVLNAELGVVLVVAVRSCPPLSLVAGVHVEDAMFPSTAQHDLTATVDDDLGPGVVDDLGCRRHFDNDRIGPAIEGDDSAFGNRAHDCVGCAARGAAAPDHVARLAGVFRKGIGRDRGRAGVLGVSRGRPGGRVFQRIVNPAAAAAGRATAGAGSRCASACSASGSGPS